MKTKISLLIAAGTCVALLASCGKSKQEIALENLEQQQTTYSENAKNDQLTSDNLATESKNLQQEATEDASKSKYDEDRSQLLQSEATEDLSKAAALNAQIEKAKVAANAAN